MDWTKKYKVSRALTLGVGPRGRLAIHSSLSRQDRSISVDAVPVLCAFGSGTSADAAFASLSEKYDLERDGFEIVLADLIAANAITPVDGEGFLPGEQAFASLSGHLRMLRDTRRVQSYQLAIERAAAGKVVVEVGCGTGLLSTFAAKAGARRVYAIEETTIADVAAAVFAANGVADRVVLIRANSMDIELPERGELLIHEIIGDEPLGEQVLPVIQDARERLLVPGAQLLPDRLDLSFVGIAVTRPEEVIDHDLVVDDLAALYGVSLEPFERRLRGQRAYRAMSLPAGSLEDHILTAEAKFASIDLSTPWESQLAEAGSVVSLEVIRGGRLAGVAALFRARLDDRTVLGNQPWLAPTSWTNAWKGFPVAALRMVAPGDRVKLLAMVEQQLGRMSVSVTLA